MNINTLEYIHRLLKDRVCKTNEAYKAARGLQTEYEERGAGKDLIKWQEAVADEYMRSHLVALNALNDFERQEWQR